MKSSRNRTAGKWRVMLFVLEPVAVNCFTGSSLDPVLEVGHIFFFFCIEQHSYAQNSFRMSHFLQCALTPACFLSYHRASDQSSEKSTATNQFTLVMCLGWLEMERGFSAKSFNNLTLSNYT